jgi:hypothetical protein
MKFRLVKSILAILTVVALIGADYGRAGCRASCFAATIHAPQHKSCCSQKRPVGNASRIRVTPCSDCPNEGSKCASCCESSPAIKHRKAVVPVDLTIVYAALPPIASHQMWCEAIRTDWGRFDLIASIRPTMQVMHCVWRK